MVPHLRVKKKGYINFAIVATQVVHYAQKVVKVMKIKIFILKNAGRFLEY